MYIFSVKEIAKKKKSFFSWVACDYFFISPSWWIGNKQLFKVALKPKKIRLGLSYFSDWTKSQKIWSPRVNNKIWENYGNGKCAKVLPLKSRFDAIENMTGSRLDEERYTIANLNMHLKSIFGAPLSHTLNITTAHLVLGLKRL